MQNAITSLTGSQRIIRHNDLGAQYTSEAFIQFVDSKKPVQSFSYKENPYNNAPVETFSEILKREEVY